MAYAAWSVSAFEQPSTSKWNILGTNDVFFNTQVGSNFSSGTGSTVWWEELGRTTLGSAGDTISVSSFAARKYLRIVCSMLPSGAITGTLRFNNDSGSNYAYNTSTNGATSALSVSQTSIIVDVDGTSTMKFATLDVVNIAAQAKSVTGIIHTESASGAANAPGMRLLAAKWHNTSNQITRADLINTAAGDFASGSQLIVLGADF